MVTSHAFSCSDRISCKTCKFFQFSTDKKTNYKCGPMPNVMIALPNIGVPSVQRRKVWLTPTTRVPCSNAAKT